MTDFLEVVRNLDSVTCVFFLRGVFPKIGVPQNGWFIMEIAIKMDDLGIPPFSETPRGSPKKTKTYKLVGENLEK